MPGKYPVIARYALGVALFGSSVGAQADEVRCHIIYGGENFTVNAPAVTDPYTVDSQKIGRYFAFRAVYVAEPARYAAVSLYVYSTFSGESVLIHEVKFPVNQANAHPPYGFTGFNYVYEPSKSSELQYWCEFVASAAP